MSYHLKEKERKKERKRGREERREEEKEISQVVVHCKNSTGKDNETPLIKKTKK